MLAANEVSRALPDGYTLLYAPSSTMAQNPHTFAQVPYDPFKDFTAISMGGRGPLVLSVSTTVPANNVKELVAYVKAHPGKVSYASFGAGTSSHIYGEAFVKKTGVDAVHIPYKGGSDAAKDLIGGRVQYMFDSASSAVITSATGKVKILAIAANARISALPDVPTFAEQGIAGLDLPSWLGFYGPAHMPAPVVAKLNAALTQGAGDAAGARVLSHGRLRSRRDDARGIRRHHARDLRPLGRDGAAGRLGQAMSAFVFHHRRRVDRVARAGRGHGAAAVHSQSRPRPFPTRAAPSASCSAWRRAAPRTRRRALSPTSSARCCRRR
jgi:hypothetical protein